MYPLHSSAPHTPERQMVRPSEMTLDTRKRLSGPGLRTFRAIADRWGLSEAERILVLGSPARSTYYSWKERAEAGGSPTLSLDCLLRISAILGIHKALSILFEDSNDALVWLRGSHRGLPFEGQAPIDLLLSGSQDGLLTVRRYLDAWRGGTAAAVDPRIAVEPITIPDITFI